MKASSLVARLSFLNWCPLPRHRFVSPNQAMFTTQNKAISGGLMVFNGALTAGAAHLIGWGIEAAVSANETFCE